MKFVIAFLVLALGACSASSEPPVVMLQMDGLDGMQSMRAAGEITKKFYADKMYEDVVFPGEGNLDSEKSNLAQRAVIVQPALNKDRSDDVFAIKCTINEPVRAAAEAIATRCEERLREIAVLLKIRLVPQSG